ncbi:hypothetical protein [Methylobacterium pseudosasicola]|nr:hypothetical protein [Methylobacterium pseudosasicola]
MLAKVRRAACRLSPNASSIPQIQSDPERGTTLTLLLPVAAG